MTPAAPARLRAQDLVKDYHADGGMVRAVRDLSLEVAAGEFVAIMGPSGSGKSTLLHILGGLEPATSGRVWLDGDRVERLSAAAWAVRRRRGIGIVFQAQAANLLFSMTVADNVELPALLAGFTAAQARERAAGLLDELGLAAKARMAPSRLSGGEQQKVALARALVNSPALLLADEPTGNLDSTSTTEVLKLVRHAHAQGQTIVMVTHDARVAGHADRILNLFDGMVCDDAPVAPRYGRG
jgi:putative ABC transport system ATP-binding protein